MDRGRHLFAPAFRYFAAVAMTGSIRAAARELNVASSAVTRQIRLIEDDLEVALFERIGRGLRLSPAGEVLLRHVQETLRDFETTTAELDALRGLSRGTVRVATVESVAEALLPQIVSTFRAGHPGIAVHVTVAGSEAIAPRVAEGSVDVGFTFNPAHMEGLQVVFSRDLAVGAVVVPDHPLAARERVSLAECLAFPIALPSPDLSIRQVLDRGLERLAARRRVAVEANSLRFMKALARGGGTVAFQTPLGLEAEIAAGSLVFVPLSDAGLPPDRFVMIVSSRRTLKLAPAVFFAAAQDALERRFAD